MFSSIIDINVEVPRARVMYKQRIQQWLCNVAIAERCHIAILHIIICDEHFLMSLNKKYLNHHTITDVITFPHETNTRKHLSGEVYISHQQVLYNSRLFDSGYNGELRRVMVHGLLHLCGYSDKTLSSQKVMRQKEDKYLQLF